MDVHVRTGLGHLSDGRGQGPRWPPGLARETEPGGLACSQLPSRHCGGNSRGDQEGTWRPEDAEPCPRLDHCPWEEGGHRAEAPSA
jgi:hypothetical protein